MLVLKCIGGAILGAIGGAIATIVGGLAIWLVAGLIMWDSEEGRDAANAASGSFLGGIVIGVIWTIQVDARRRRVDARRRRQRRRAAEGRWNVRRNRLTDLVTSSRATFLSLDELVDSVNSHLARAEKEFKERASRSATSSRLHELRRVASFDERQPNSARRCRLRPERREPKHGAWLTTARIEAARESGGACDTGSVVAVDRNALPSHQAALGSV